MYNPIPEVWEFNSWTFEQKDRFIAQYLCIGQYNCDNAGWFEISDDIVIVYKIESRYVSYAKALRLPEDAERLEALREKIKIFNEKKEQEWVEEYRRNWGEREEDYGEDDRELSF